MPTTPQDLYAEVLQRLPPTERLQLAALILSGLARPDVVVVQASDAWNADDERDVAAFALRHADALYPEDEPLV